MNKLLLIANNVKRLFYYGIFVKGSKIHCDNDCSIRVYQSFVENISYYAGSMLNAFMISHLRIMLKIVLT